MDLDTSFGRWLRARRRALDLTQDDLARRVGCAVVTIQKIEADERRPSRQLAERMADGLQVTVDQRTAIITLARAEPYLDSATTTPPRTPQQPSTHLPTPLTRLIGRKQDIAAVRTALLQGQARLLTLIGPPGIGKTRLSLAIAHESQVSFSDGATFVALTPISDPALVLATIAHALGVTETANQPLLAQLTTALQAQRRLLLLDNFEQVLAAAPLVVELLEACPGVKALITSRAALHVRGERLYMVPPLQVPDLTHLPALGALAHTPAVALFVEHARAVRPTFKVTVQNAATVAAICVRLDGLPLAIELAAARIEQFAPDALLARLHVPLALLTDGPRDLPMRQQTMRSTIDWSYNLLNADQQMLFRRLGVFVGGFTLEAAESVCADAGLSAIGSDTTPSPSQPIHDRLTSLLNQSLLVVLAPVVDDPRFGMLELVREYARDRLREAGEAMETGRRHAVYLLTMVETVVPKASGSHRRTALDQLEAELPNIRAAFVWAEAVGDHDLALCLASALAPFWGDRGHRGEGCTMLQAALSQPSAGPPITRARALHALGHLRVGARAYWHETVVALEESLTIFRALGDLEGSAEVLNSLRSMTYFRGDMAQALVFAEASLQDSRAAQNPERIAWALQGVAKLACIHGNNTWGDALLDESLELFEKLKHPTGRAIGLFWRAWELQRRGDSLLALALMREIVADQRKAGPTGFLALALYCLGLWEADHTQALDLLNESLAMYRKVGELEALPIVLRTLGEVALAQGDHAAARERFRESQVLCRELGNTWGIGAGLIGAGHVAVGEGDTTTANQRYTDALTIFASLPDWDDRMRRFGIAASLDGLAGVALPTNPERATSMYGAAAAQRASVGPAALTLFEGPYRLPPHSTTDAQAREYARAALGDTFFARAWAAGQVLTLEQVVRYALEAAPDENHVVHSAA